MKTVNLIITIIAVLVILPLLYLVLADSKKIQKQKTVITKQDSIIQNLGNKIRGLEYKIDSIQNKLLAFENLENPPQNNTNGANTEPYTPEEKDINQGNNPNAEREVYAETINYRQQDFYTYIVDLTNSNLSFNFKTNSGEQIKTLSKLNTYYSQQNKNLIFATNGGIFSNNLEPLGLYVENGSEMFSLNLQDGAGNFFLKPNGIFYINKWNGAGIIESSKYETIAGKISYAIQSGPLLLLNGNVHGKFTENSSNKYIRNGVGIIDNKTIVFAISKKPVNFFDFAMLFKEEFNCANALYLDGAISEMYLPALNLTQTQNTFSVLISVTE